MTSQKLEQSIDDLAKALKLEKKALRDRVYYAAISKCFEVCLEYAWKCFKSVEQAEGFEVYSPRDAIKHAGKIKLIDDVELWLGFLEDRNQAVHDYNGIAPEAYLKTIKTFYREVKKMKFPAKKS